MRVPNSPNGSGSWAYHKYHSLKDFPDRYGKVKGVEDYCRKAQIVSYEQYRSLQEAFNYKMWDWYAGMLVWKNQNPWTALRGSFYDYYLDYQGGYFGYKHGAAPLHIQLNLNDSAVCIVNQTVSKIDKYTATIQMYDLHGGMISEKKESVSVDAQSTKLLNKVILPATTSGISFLKLSLFDGANLMVDENLYWLTTKPKSYEALNELATVKLSATAEKSDTGTSYITVSNPGKETAFFIRLKVLNAAGELILPVFLDENYFTLLPGESRKVKLEVKDAFRNKSEVLKLSLEGWNIEPSLLNL